MATNLVFSDIESLREIWPVGSEVASGTALLNGTRAGVALTDSGGRTRSAISGAYTISGIPSGGVGLDALQVSVATTGTWEYTGITGVTSSTAQNTAIYITSGGALTTTSSGNTLWGRTNYPKGYVKATGKAPVKIGA